MDGPILSTPSVENHLHIHGKICVSPNEEEGPDAGVGKRHSGTVHHETLARIWIGEKCFIYIWSRGFQNPGVSSSGKFIQFSSRVKKLVTSEIGIGTVRMQVTSGWFLCMPVFLPKWINQSIQKKVGKCGKWVARSFNISCQTLGARKREKESTFVAFSSTWCGFDLFKAHYVMCGSTRLSDLRML